MDHSNSSITTHDPFGTTIRRNHARIDELLVSMFFGWTMALMCVVIVRLCSTVQYRGELKLTTYITLCSLLLAAAGTLACLSWMYVINYYRPGQAEMVAFLFLWTFQAHVYFQLVITRILVLSRRRASNIRLATFGIIGVINIMMFGIWLPQTARPLDSRFPGIMWVPRVEKALLLALDLAMNIYFLRLVRMKLLAGGFTKYRNFVHYNYKIVILSLACDCFLLGMQWYPKNDVMFVPLYPCLYLSKLVLEMSICERMALSSRSSEGARLDERATSPAAQNFWKLEANIDSTMAARTAKDIGVKTVITSTSNLREQSEKKYLPMIPFISH